MSVPVTRRRVLHWFFDLSVVMKGVNGFLEMIGGVLLLVFTPKQLSAAVIFLTQYELSDDPQDAISNAMVHFVSHLQVNTKIFAAFYLLCYGLLKIILAYNLLQERLWAFPVAIGVIQAFLLYLIYRVSIHYSTGLAIVIVLDLFAILFIWSEWRTRKKMIITTPRPAC
jgi:uncharacterized membrane protein